MKGRMWPIGQSFSGLRSSRSSVITLIISKAYYVFQVDNLRLVSSQPSRHFIIQNFTYVMCEHNELRNNFIEHVTSRQGRQIDLFPE